MWCKLAAEAPWCDPARINHRETFVKPWVLFSDKLSSLERRTLSFLMFFAVSLMVGVKDGSLMLSLQCHLLLFWRCQERNRLSGIKYKKKRFRRAKDVVFLARRVSSSCVLWIWTGRTPDTSALSWLVFARPGSGWDISHKPLSRWLSKTSWSFTTDGFFCVEQKQMTPSIKCSFTNIQWTGVRHSNLLLAEAPGNVSRCVCGSRFHRNGFLNRVLGIWEMCGDWGSDALGQSCPCFEEQVAALPCFNNWEQAASQCHSYLLKGENSSSFIFRNEVKTTQLGREVTGTAGW